MKSMTSLRFVLCDVFTDRPLAGQPLAVFTRATGLSDERMQALACELSAPATVFVQPPAAGGHAKVRVFDRSGELREPGHALLGAAVVLGGPLQAEEVRLETQRGLVAIRLEREGARIVFGWIFESFPVTAGFAEVLALADALGLDPSQLEREPPQQAAGHVVVAVSSSQLTKLAPEPHALGQLAAERICVIAGERERYRARVLVPGREVCDAPITPVTAAAVAAFLASHGREPAAASWSIEFGAELGRPSLAHVRRAEMNATDATPGASPVGAALWVGGAAVVVGRGELVIRE